MPLIRNTTATTLYDYSCVSKESALAIFRLVLISQFCLATVISVFRVGLFADGSFFAYTIAAGNPWELFWHKMSARLTVYAIDIMPLSALVREGFVKPDQLGYAYGFMFYIWIFLQHSIVYLIARRSHGEFLIFPAINFIFLSLGCYGFPTEMIYVPGFFWISFFSALRFGWSSPLTLVSLALLIFCHEFSLLSAAALLFAGYIVRRKVAKPQVWPAALVLLLGFAALVGLKTFGGSVAGNQNSLSAMDPREFLQGPALWVAISAVAVSAIAFNITKRSSTTLLCAIPFLTVFTYALFVSGLNYASGRYTSRTLLAIGTPLLGLFCALTFAQDRVQAPADFLTNSRRAWLCIHVGYTTMMVAFFMFLIQWVIYLNTIEAKVLSPIAGNPMVVSLAEGSAADPELYRLTSMAGYTWTLPFLSLMTSSDLRPHRIIFDGLAGQGLCTEKVFEVPNASALPIVEISLLRDYACAQPMPPPRRGLMRRMMDHIRRQTTSRHANQTFLDKFCCCIIG